MDIKHLRYFTAIVENDFNLRQTAEILYTSQPALSVLVSEFEKREKVQLFKRNKGRISGLTHKGEHYYLDAKNIIKMYNSMFERLHSEHKEMVGKVKIGIPPLVLSVVFSQILPEIIFRNSNIKFSIIELGAYHLWNELLLGNVDIAVLLQVDGLATSGVDIYEIQRSELSVFLSKYHRLSKKNKISWENLNKGKMAIFNKTFMVHHLLRRAFERNDIHPDIVLETGCWDFLLSIVRNYPEILSILPAPIINEYPVEGVLSIPMEEPISWRVNICRLKKQNYEPAEAYVIDELLQAFKTRC